MRQASDIPIVILAAGQSRRMRGTDKLLQDVGGVPLLRHQVEKAVATGAPVYVVLPVSPHPRHAALAGCNAKKVLSPDTHLGMSASLRAGLTALPVTAAAVMILLADLPDLTTDDLTALLDCVDLKQDTLIWRGTSADGAPGHPVIFAASLFPALTRLTGDRGAADVISAHRDKTKFVKLPADHARRDLDTPEDWSAWRSEQHD